MPHEMLSMLVGDADVEGMNYCFRLFHILEQMVQNRPEKMTVLEMGVIEETEADVLKCRVSWAFQGSIQDSWYANSWSTANPCA